MAHTGKYSRRHYSNRCFLCSKHVNVFAYVELPCNHSFHTKCLQESFLYNLEAGFDDHWGVRDMHCPLPHCTAVIKHFCKCHERKRNCEGCICYRDHRDNDIVKGQNEACTGKKIHGFEFTGEEREGKGNIAFVAVDESEWYRHYYDIASTRP